jgi:cyclophilin family peptidyl-prolyl cis-trans isomerase
VGTEKRARQKANRQLKLQQQVKQEQRQKLSKRIVFGGIAVVGLLALVLFLAWLAGGDDDDEPITTTTPPPATSDATDDTATDDTATDDTTAASTEGVTPLEFTYGTGACPPDDLTEPVKEFDDAPQQCIDPSKSYTARIVTDHGDIVIALDTEQSPGTVNNFVTLARYGYYDDTQIFRGADGIDIIQGGGTSPRDQFSYTIPDEGTGYTYPPGKIAMANTGQPDSAGAQWFITVGPDSANLDRLGTYAVFGDVVEGLDVAEAILALAQPDETLSETVVVETIEITES